MNRRRLDQLRTLTQGVALVGLGFLTVSGAACGKKEPVHTNGPPFEPIHVNIPVTGIFLQLPQQPVPPYNGQRPPQR